MGFRVMVETNGQDIVLFLPHPIAKNNASCSVIVWPVILTGLSHHWNKKSTMTKLQKHHSSFFITSVDGQISVAEKPFQLVLFSRYTGFTLLVSLGLCVHSRMH